MANLLDTLEEIIVTLNDLKSVTSQFENLKNIPDEIIKFVFETEIDYQIQNPASIGKEQREKAKDAVNKIRERITLFHHSLLQIHAPEKSQQGLMKKRGIESITKINGLLRKIELNI